MDAPKCSVSVFEVIGGVVADGICLMAIEIPHDGSPAYWTVGRYLAAGTVGQNLRLLAYRASKKCGDYIVRHCGLLCEPFYK